MEPLNLHEWTPCEVYGHQYEYVDEERFPGLLRCTDSDCGQEYEE